MLFGLGRNAYSKIVDALLLRRLPDGLTYARFGKAQVDLFFF